MASRRNALLPLPHPHPRLGAAIKAAAACSVSAFHSPVSSAPIPSLPDRPADMAAAHRLVIVRHGESAWNQENRFCGWFDADLSEKGVEEARRGALAIKEAGMKFDVCYTSVLKRAVKTLWTIMEGTDQMWLPVIRTWRLNERHYGGLTGLNKAETAEKHGEEQVKIWRRSFDIPPPPMDAEHPYHKIISQVRAKPPPLKQPSPPTPSSLLSSSAPSALPNTATTTALKCVLICAFFELTSFWRIFKSAAC